MSVWPMAVRRSLTYSKLGYQNHLCVWLAVGGLKKRQSFTFSVLADHRPSFSNLFHLSDHDLAGGLEHVFFPHIGNNRIILPIDELIFFKVVIAPPTSDS